MPDNSRILSALANDGALTFISASDITENNDNLMSLFDTKVKRDILISALVELIALQSLNRAIFENPLKKFKIAPLEYGKTEEEIFVNMVDGRDYDFYGLDQNELFRIYKDNTIAVFHEVNARKQFPTTLSYDELRSAFASHDGLQSLIDAKISVLYDSAEYWEYLRTKLLITGAIQNGLVYPQHVDAVTDETSAKAFLKYVRAYVESARFPNRLLNYAGSDSTCKAEGMTLFVTPLVKATLDVDTLASIFHLSYAEVESKIEVVDSFDDASIMGVLVDDRFLHIRQQLAEMTNNFNAVNMSWNYFYNLWEMFSISPFRSAVVFTTDTIGGTGATGSIAFKGGTSITATKGTQIDLSALISDTTSGAYVPQLIDYEITTTGTSPKTVIIPATSILLISDDESLTRISVKAVNRLDSSVNATATVTITG